MYAVREALESDVERIRDIIIETYGKDYAYPQFYDLSVLKRMVFADDTLLLVAEEQSSGLVVGTASVIFETGAYADQIGEFGRLMVDPRYRRRGIAKQLLKHRLELAQERLHLAIVEPRLLHPFSQKNVVAQGFAPVGLLPMELLLGERESVGLCVRYFNDSLNLRRNHPRIIPEAHALARLAMTNCGLACDAIVDDHSAPYPLNSDYTLHELSSAGYLPLLQIERGRVEHREIFGPMRLHYGMFKIRAKQAQYIIVQEHDRIVAAIGLIVNDVDKSARVFELIAVDDGPIRFLLGEVCRRCGDDWGLQYVSVDVSAYAPRMQRTLLELGFVPVAYVPAMVFEQVERLDAMRMVRLLVPPQLDNIQLIDELEPIGKIVVETINARHVLPSLARVVEEAALCDGLNQEQIERLAAVCQRQSYASGEVIFDEGARDDCVCLLLSGSVEVTRRACQQPLGHLGGGESLGEMALLGGQSHFATATALEAVEAALIPFPQLDALVRARPDIGVVLYRNLARGLSVKLQRVDLSAPTLSRGSSTSISHSGRAAEHS